jgi:hypothetical protein
LVAAIAIISQSNKDRPEHRLAFAGKSAALLQEGVSVAIVDLVTTREFSLYHELMELIGVEPPMTEPSPIYAVECRMLVTGQKRRLEAWENSLAIGRSLPILPLWLSPDPAVPLDLEESYEASCRALRIP